MQKMILTAYLIAGIVIKMDGVNAQASQEFFSAQEWNEIKKLDVLEHDVIAMHDGTRLSGTVDKIPKLSYSFGHLEFDPSEVVAILFHPSQKMELITTEGLHFVGNMVKEFCLFTKDDERQKVIFPNKVDWIVFRNRKLFPKKRKERTYCLKMRNGDLLPLALEDTHTIVLKNEEQELVIQSDSIHHVQYDQALSGLITDAVGQLVELRPTPVKDSLLTAKLAHNLQDIKLDWRQIDSLQEITPVDSPEALLANRYTEIHTPTEATVVARQEEFIAMADRPQKTKKAGEIAYIFLGDDSQAKLKEEQYLKEGEGIGVNIPREAFDWDESKLEANDRIDSDIEFISQAPQKSDWKVYAPSYPEYYHPRSFAYQNNLEKNPTFGDPLVRNIPARPDLIKSGDKLNLFDQDLDELASDPDPFGTFLSNESGEEYLAKDLGDQNHVSEVTIKGPSARINNSKSKLYKRQSMVLVAVNDKPSFYIDRNKVTNKEYKKFLDATHYSAPEHWVDGEIPDGKANDPVVNVTYKDALVYAVWSGKRLPSETEWQLALKRKFISYDPADLISEWTATPYAHSFGEQEKKQSIIHPKYYTTYKHDFVRVCTGRPVAPLCGDECNLQTGFRCAASLKK